MNEYEVLSEEYESTEEMIDGYARTEPTRFYAVISADSRSKAKYIALKRMGFSDFRDAPRLSIRLRTDEDRWKDEEIESLSSELSEEQAKNWKLERELAYHRGNHLRLRGAVEKLIPSSLLRYLLGLSEL